MSKSTVLRSINSCPEFAVLTQDTHFIACCPESGHCPESGQHKIGPLGTEVSTTASIKCFLACMFPGLVNIQPRTGVDFSFSSNLQETLIKTRGGFQWHADSATVDFQI